jgi:hypothetical protein
VESLERRTLFASIVVNSALDNAIAGDGLTTLREAITTANATPTVADTISFNLGAGPQTINLGSVLPDLSNMTIQGPGADKLTVRRNTGGNYRIFNVPSTRTVTLSGMTFSNGRIETSAGGGGILNSGTLTIDACVISNNSTTASGGGINNSGTLNVTSSTLSGNSATVYGGAFAETAGSTYFKQCTFNGNSAQTGGAICEYGPGQGRTSAERCTISNNTATGGGGGGIASLGDFGVMVAVTIVSGNSAQNTLGYIDDWGFNFIDGDAKLAPLANNGGPTPTMALNPDSPCINRSYSSPTPAPAFDQRGAPFARTIGGLADIGAFESNVLNTAPRAIAMPAITVLDDHPKSVNLRSSFEDSESDPADLVYTVVGNTNPALFDSTTVDGASDVLTLDCADGAEGVATVTVRGTDPGGLFVDNSFDVTVLASNYVVNSTADNTVIGDGMTTLREAITAANLNVDANTISFNLGAGAHTINLAGKLPDLNTEMSIQGPGADLLSVRRDTGGDYAVFTSAYALFASPDLAFPVALSGMTITNGAGGIRDGYGIMTVSDCAIRDNQGSGIANSNFYSPGDLTVRNSTISGNHNSSSGGGIDANIGSATTIQNCTITGNSTDASSGGGIFALGNVTLENSTISGNSALTFGGGIAVSAGLTTVRNSIVAQNAAPIGRDIFTVNSFVFVDGGHNFIGTRDGDARLAALANNGGTTQTMALLPDSPCINRGDPAYVGPLTFDQRGTPFARKVGPRIDIGAFESNVVNTAPTAGSIDPVTMVDAYPATVALRPSFDDAEDGASGLVYTVVGNTNPALFQSTSVDNATDVLTLTGANGAEGVATVTIRATDSGGLFVEKTVDVTVFHANYIVNSTGDDMTVGNGLTTLREAITFANMNADANTITFNLGAGTHTINLSQALPTLIGDTNIQGPGRDLLTVRRNSVNSFHIVDIAGNLNATLAGMTVANGRSYGGGGVVVSGANVTIDHCNIIDNYSYDFGGGIASYYGKLSIIDSTIGNNTTAGVYDTTVYNESGELTLTNVTLQDNPAGGIFSSGPTTILGRLDLGKNDLTVFYNTDQQSPLASLAALMQSARNGGDGIFSSEAIPNFTTLGIADFSLYGAVIVRYTFGGDANLDGKLDIDDYVCIDQGIAAGKNGWANGDFNYDGKINIDDYLIIDSNLGIQGPPLSVSNSIPTVGSAMVFSTQVISTQAIRLANFVDLKKKTTDLETDEIGLLKFHGP